MEKGLISVIIPIYNVERYLHRCIESVRRQTYQRLEIILVNDGSWDNCPAICDEYAKLDRRIKVLHKKNGGLSDARNQGMKLANGEYFAFVDSDDFIHPQMYELLLKGLREYNGEVSVCGIWEGVNKEEKYEPSVNKFFSWDEVENIRTIENENVFEELYREDSVDFIVAWNKLYSHRWLEKLQFPIGKYHEDEFVVPSVLYEADRVVYLPAKMYFYIRREDSITTSEFSLGRLDLEKALYQRIQFYQKNQLKKFIPKGVHHYMGQGFFYMDCMRERFPKERKALFRRMCVCYMRYGCYLPKSEFKKTGKELFRYKRKMIVSNDL